MTIHEDLPFGTIDITDLVEKMRSTFVMWASAYLFGLIILVPGLGWIAFPVISSLVKAAVNWGVTALSKAAVLEAFFLNTSIRKASQAQDYIEALSEKNALPPTASDKEYEDAEKKEMEAFRNFVRVTR